VNSGPVQDGQGQYVDFDLNRSQHRTVKDLDGVRTLPRMILARGEFQEMSQVLHGAQLEIPTAIIDALISEIEEDPIAIQNALSAGSGGSGESGSSVTLVLALTSDGRRISGIPQGSPRYAGAILQSETLARLAADPDVTYIPGEATVVTMKGPHLRTRQPQPVRAVKKFYRWLLQQHAWRVETLDMLYRQIGELQHAFLLSLDPRRL
jgi:hypothetical protein